MADVDEDAKDRFYRRNYEQMMGVRPWRRSEADGPFPATFFRVLIVFRSIGAAAREMLTGRPAELR